ncbi:MAG: septal ring factor EnvC (AmiA/AmiB activator) [Candidatus Woesearchaeota archaeon]|jgi:septal ring factor EnvC (AmiA/AmiB activator)
MDPDRVYYKASYKAKPNKSQSTFPWIKTLVILLIVVGLFFFVVKPSYVGYKTYKQLEDAGITVSEATATLAGIESQVQDVQTSLEQCTLTKQQIETQLTKTQSQVTDLQKTSQGASAVVKTDNARLNAESNALAEENYKLQTRVDDFSDFIRDTARSKCCKERVDNPSIDSYDFNDNKITCGEDLDEGLSC